MRRAWVIGGVAVVGLAALAAVSQVDRARDRRAARASVGRLDGAAELDQLVEKRPGDAEIRFLRGRHRRLTGRPTVAAEDFDEADRLGHPGAELVAERLWLLAAADLAAAAPDLEERLNADPDEAGALAALASGLLQRRSYDAAEALASRWVRAHPADGEARWLRGRLYSDIQSNRQAKDDLAEALRLRPDAHYAPAARRLYAAALYDAGEHAAAAAEFRRLLDADPGDAILRYSVGRSLTSMGELGEAKRYLASALEARPGFGPALFELSTVLESEGDLSGALAALEGAERAVPESVAVHARLARVLGLLGRSAEAADRAARAQRMADEQARAKDEGK